MTTADDPEYTWSIVTRWDPDEEVWVARDTKERIEVEHEKRHKALHRLADEIEEERSGRFVA